MKTLSFSGNNSFASRCGKPFCLLLCISFLSTGLSAFLTFPRSLRLVDLGVGIALYGLLISASGIVTMIADYFVGKVIDRRNCLDVVLKASLAISIVCHLGFTFISDAAILSILLVIENASTRLFTVFILQAVSYFSGNSYGTALGYYKISGSAAWTICALISGYIISYFGFQYLMLIVVAVCAIKLTLLTILFREYKKKSQKSVCDAPGKNEGKKVQGEKGMCLTLPIVNALVLYMLLQIQSNGGFSYLQIYLSTVLGYDDIHSGYVVSASGIFELFIAVVVGKLCDRGGKSTEVVIAMCAFLSALRWIILGNVSISFYGLLFTQFLHGVMICTLNVAFLNYFRFLSPNGFGRVIGIAGALSSFGSVFGAGIFGYFADRLGLDKAYVGLGAVGIIGAGIFSFVMLLNRLTNGDRHELACRKVT